MLTEEKKAVQNAGALSSEEMSEVSGGKSAGGRSGGGEFLVDPSEGVGQKSPIQI